MTQHVLNAVKTATEMMYDRKDFGWSKKISEWDENVIIDLTNKLQLIERDFVDEQNGKTMSIIFALQPKFRYSDVKTLIDDKIKVQGVDFILLIVKDKVSSTNIKSIEESKVTQVFQLKELQYNVTKHELVPKHELIGSDQESYIQELVDKYLLKNRFQFPLILKSDPVARYLNAKTGNLVKITRSSPTSGVYEFYRCCM